MEGKKVKSIFVAWLVLYLATMQCEGKLSGFQICFASCMPKCISGKPIFEAAVCASGCLISCIGSDHRITTHTQYYCSLGCARSSCNKISAQDEQATEKVNSCVDGCVNGCVKNN